MNSFLCCVLVAWTACSVAQEVQVSSGKNTVILSVSAQKPYDLVSGQRKLPVLSVQCVQKGKKSGHIITFAPGGSVVENGPESDQATFTMTIGGGKHQTHWVNFGDTITFAYFAKHEPERTQFIQELIDSGTVSIQFQPFLTGQTISSTFDLSKLHAEMETHPECAVK